MGVGSWEAPGAWASVFVLVPHVKGSPREDAVAGEESSSPIVAQHAHDLVVKPAVSGLETVEDLVECDGRLTEFPCSSLG